MGMVHGGGAGKGGSGECLFFLILSFSALICADCER